MAGKEDGMNDKKGWAIFNYNELIYPSLRTTRKECKRHMEEKLRPKKEALGKYLFIRKVTISEGWHE